ncbi:hypothetical protein O3S80_03970 [Streptomyces sp. Lzd4kr]|nr:hypothetical protein [Streptomyces sp. Lzd4kr]
MFARIRRPNRTITETVHGVDVEYTVPDSTPVIRLPFNLDAALRKALFTLAVIMTIGAIVWGTVAIGSMLALLAPPWAAYLVAGVFDAGWAACLIAEWILRYDSKRAALPQRVGLAMLAVSIAAIILHGHRDDALLVGIVGALVSAAAKGVWFIGMHTIRIKLEPKYEAYLNAQRQKAGTEQALALGERDRMLTQDQTVKMRLALEARRGDEPTVDQLVNRPQSTPVHAPDQPAEEIDTTPEPVAVHAVQTTVNRPAHTTPVEDQVDVLLSRLRKGEHITKARAAEILGVPESTAYRRLTKATSLLNQYN